MYVISVAADLCGTHPQTLRVWERHGLLRPARTPGGSRRYSDHDVALARRVVELGAAGVSLAGIARILELEREVAHLHAVVADLHRQLATRRR